MNGHLNHIKDITVVQAVQPYLIKGVAAGAGGMYWNTEARTHPQLHHPSPVPILWPHLN